MRRGSLAARIVDSAVSGRTVSARRKVDAWLPDWRRRGSRRASAGPCRSSRRAAACGRCRLFALSLGSGAAMRPGSLRVLLRSDPDRTSAKPAAPASIAVRPHASDEAEAMRRVAPHEGRSGAADRFRRYRRRLARDAGDAGADRTCRLRRAVRAVRFLLRDAVAARAAHARRSGAAGDRLRLYRACDGQDGCVRTELFERHRSDRVLRSRCARPAAGYRAAVASMSASRAAWSSCCRSAPADGYVFRVDLRLRPDPASTQIAISVPAGARLLRASRPELGTLRA